MPPAPDVHVRIRATNLSGPAFGGLQVALGQAQSRFRALNAEERSLTAVSETLARSSTNIAERIRHATAATGPFGRGLLTIRNQELAAAQAARANEQAIHGMTAAMTRAAAVSTNG